MACKHLQSYDLAPPRPDQAVYREDCTQCFDSIDDPTGLDVCLHCFNGGCSAERQHSTLHFQRHQHPLAVNIRRSRRIISRDEPPQKISKLAIAAETEADRYELLVHVHCIECKVDDIDHTSGQLAKVVGGILKANTFSKQEEVKAWEQTIISCEHILTLNQDESRKIESHKLGHCSMCDLQENLWLCLQCGNLGCGRAQFGGVGGHSHGLAHAKSSDHAVAVKLGSITPEGTADVYCYRCDEERVDENLGLHLSHWGIILADRQKTEKSMTELQVEQNHRWDFSLTSEDGKELTPVYGEGLTGLKNLGNSCYLASSLQCLFSLPQFQQRYYLPNTGPLFPPDPALDLETQLRKIADGLISGRYSKPDTNLESSSESAQSTYQKGIAPSMLKHLLGKGHSEFSTMRQQDAFELLLHVLKLVTRSPHPAPLADPTECFRFVMEQRLQCRECKKVRYSSTTQDNITIPIPVAPNDKDSTDLIEGQYKPVTIKECFDCFTAEETVDLACSACGSESGFLKRSLFKTLPEVLIVNARRFVLLNWVPTKVDVPVIIGDEPFDLDSYVSKGHLTSEELLPEDPDISESSFFEANAEAMQILEQMGFPQVRCTKALQATGNSDPNAAMEWLFEHMEDSDIDEPLHSKSSQISDSVDPEKLASLGLMGFGSSQAQKALKETGGNLERAVDWLFNHSEDQDRYGNGIDFGYQSTDRSSGSDTLPATYQLQSIICHKGASIHAGHYVAFVRKHLSALEDLKWVLFNDEKVVLSKDVDALKKFAYVYFFQKLPRNEL